jgi:hypothetical protein
LTFGVALAAHTFASPRSIYCRVTPAQYLQAVAERLITYTEDNANLTQNGIARG